MKIAIIGSGNVGSALGANLSAHDYDVTFGVREGRNADEAVARSDGRATQAPIADAVTNADVVFLAVPPDAAVDAVRALDLAGKIVVDCNNPLRWDGGPVWNPPAEGSLAQAIAAVTGARVVKAFNTFGAELHANPSLAGGGVDLPIASDDDDAKAIIAALGERCGFAPVDAGPLRNAAVLENVAMLWIHLAMVGGQGRQFGYRRVGR